ncbi:NADPH-glutathione reductase [Hasllibacter halocynthiae]|uniref:NADPH-glutathione reductase n=1 Tax=Hasllibacter halocynthiae TaxID=595589 RepID=A0A2T0X6Z0_9RHOB|nr:glutathione-disulfide reductase [Hasllibacter halocynthiae]PRY94699.1 NADPH-glutathione reductase [Hasllibacter halocynthiae]
MAHTAHDYDLFVIGGGSGGVRAARRAAAAGARVALAEEYRLGGTCVIRGCVPKKLMVFASEYGPDFHDAKAFGWDVPEAPAFRWPPFRERLHAELDRLEGVYRRLLEDSGVEVVDARATLTGPNGVALSNGREAGADTILVATGGRPALPDFPGAELGLTSNDMFLLEELPRRLLVVGGGYIACEFAGMMNGMGSEVCIYHRGAQILRGFDDEARGLIAEGMRDRGIDISLGTSVLEMRRKDDGTIWTKSTNGHEGEFDAVLLATGRTPNTEGMGLREAGVEITRKGTVCVDAMSRTNVPSIWAIGDVTDRVALTPVAIREAMAFVRTRFGGEDCPPDHDLIPSAVFTQPEMGAVGMTEEQALERDVPAEIYATSFRPMRTAFAGRPDRVLMKMVVHAETRVVLGVHIVSPGAGEMIQFAGVAVKAGLTKEQFDATCAVHPTVAEEMVTMDAPVRTL